MWHKKDNFCTLLWHWKRLFSPLFCCRFKFRPVFLLVLYGNWLPFEYFIIFNALSVYDYTWLVAGERIGDPNFLWKCFWNYLFNLRMELNFTSYWRGNSYDFLCYKNLGALPTMTMFIIRVKLSNYLSGFSKTLS